MKYVTYSPSLSPKLGIEGYSINWTKYVFLSSNVLSNMHPITCLRTRMGEFSGTLFSDFIVQDENNLQVNINSLPNPGIYDVIAYNVAGFAKLSDTNRLIVYNPYTPTPTPTFSPTPSITPSNTPTPTPSITPSHTPTNTTTPSISLTISETPAVSLTPTTTPSVTPTFTPTCTVTPTFTPTCTVTPTYTPTCTVTPTFTPTNTVTPSITPTNTITPTRTPNTTNTPYPTLTPTPTSTTPSAACLTNWSLVNFTGTTFRNGDPIPQITDQEEWNTATGPGWCYFDNDPANDTIYGKLYNRYAVTDMRGLAPEGYHVPSLAEWEDLIICLGGSDAGGGIWPVAGAKMKTTGTIQDNDGLWNSPNVATNESGFSVVPAGCRTGGFINLHSRGSFWVNDSDTCINFNNGASYVYIGGDSTTVGYSVRLKQGEIPIPTPTMTPSPTNTPSSTSTSISYPYAYVIEFRESDGSNNIYGWLNQQEACQGSNRSLTVYSDSSTFVEGMKFYSDTNGSNITNVVSWTDYYYYNPLEGKVFRWLDGNIAGTITGCI